MKERYYELIDERVFEQELENGLRLFVIPKPGFQKTFVTYTTQFGSLDNQFKPLGQDQFVTVPDGVAHFLEHKLFEKEEEDLFTAFAEDNAQANAFTSFDRTSYLFSATDNIENNIKRLLTMVETPYFTKETVDKEKGIIAEEIKMYQEQPGYKLMFNTLRAMYQQHPIRVDIAGSVESIYDITKDDLYLCYETFYHPSNMVLFVVGDVDPEAICRIVKQHEDARNKVNQPKIERGLVNEPEDVKEAFVTESMKIQSPRLMLGFKNKPLQEAPQKYVQRDLEMSLFFELIFGEETDFYQNLLNEGLIDDTFGYQFVLEPTYSFSIVTSATEEPDKLKKLLLDELRDKKGNFQDAEAFELLKKQFIGEFISSLNSPEYIANQYTKLYFEGVSVFDMLDIVENITLDSINETSSLYLNLDQQVDSRLEIKKVMKALVLGGSGSIGSEIVKQLLTDGFEVYVQYYRTDINELTSKFNDDKVRFIQADLSQTIDIDKTFGDIKSLDCLIYASGQSLYGVLQDMKDHDIDACYQLNVLQLIRLCRYFVDVLRQSANGRIIVISSIWGETGASMETIYSAMKSAQLGFVKALSQELALTSVTVNAIAPGFVAGNMASEWQEDELQAMITELPQQRLVLPSEVAHTCAYLYHPNARSVTGTIQKVNGAWYI